MMVNIVIISNNEWPKNIATNTRAIVMVDNGSNNGSDNGW